MKNLVMIAPIPAQVQAARNLGIRAITIWDRADAAAGFYQQMAMGAKELSEIYLECELNSTSDLLRCIQEIKNKGITDFEIFHGGMDHFFKSYFEVATVLGKSKNQAGTVAIFSNKSALRKMLDKSARLKIPTETVYSVPELKRSLQQIQFPVIVKPAESFGSKDIHLVRNALEADIAIAAFEAQAPRALMIEEFFAGDQFSVEAVTIDGHHRILGITAKFPVLPPHFVEVGGIFPAQISSKNEEILQSATRELLDIAGVQEGVTHTEIILSGDRPIVVESHLRAGGLIPFLVNASFGISLHELAIASLFKDMNLPEPVRNHVSILSILQFETGKTISEVTGRKELSELPTVWAHNIWAKPGQILKKPEFNNERHGYVVVSGQNLEAAQKNLEFAVGLLQPHYQEEK